MYLALAGTQVIILDEIQDKEFFPSSITNTQTLLHPEELIDIAEEAMLNILQGEW